MENEVTIDYAPKELRFFTYLIDTFVFWVLWIAHIFIFQDFVENQDGNGNMLVNTLYLIFFYCMIPLVFEVLWGRTIGKFMTGTKVIGFDGNKPSIKALLIRNFARVIPFDQLSFLIFKAGWHDSLSNTIVVRV